MEYLQLAVTPQVSDAQQKQSNANQSSLSSQGKKVFIAEDLGLVASGIQAQSSESMMLPEGLKLVTVLNNDCMVANNFSNQGSMSSQIASLSAGSAGLREESFEFELEKETSLAELESIAQNDPCVKLVGVDMSFSINAFDDPQADAQQQHDQMKTREAYRFFYESTRAIASNESVVIAIVDTGVEYTHEDLSSMMWQNANNEYGFDFVNNDADPMDDQGHGTHCAGITASANDNQIGGSGVMGFNAEIMAVKVLDETGGGSLQSVSNGIRYAADNGADVISMSLGGPGASTVIRDAIAYAVAQGSVVVSAAGNDDREITAGNFYSPGGYSAAYEGAVTVASIDSNSERRSSFSNFSTTYVDIAAPGSEISTGANRRGILAPYIGNTYARLSGTSMATPAVAGALGIIIGYLRSNGIDPSPAEVEEILKEAADKRGGLATEWEEGRLLDLEKLGLYLQSSYVVKGTTGLGGE